MVGSTNHLERLDPGIVSKPMGKSVARTTCSLGESASDVLASDTEACGTGEGRPFT